MRAWQIDAALVFGFINHTRPAATQLLEDAVVRNSSAYHDGRPASARPHLNYRNCTEVNSGARKSPRKRAGGNRLAPTWRGAPRQCLERFAKRREKADSRREIQRRVERGL